LRCSRIRAVRDTAVERVVGSSEQEICHVKPRTTGSDRDSRCLPIVESSIDEGTPMTSTHRLTAAGQVDPLILRIGGTLNPSAVATGARRESGEDR
jgi:hypothetical protein